MNGEGFYIRDGIVVIPKSVITGNLDIAAQENHEDTSACVRFTLLTGCFEHPLTSGPSKDINSSLLGVWEARTPKAELIVPGLFRLPAIVTTSVFAPWAQKAPRGAGIRRLDINVCLTAAFSPKMRSTSGEIPEGAYVFANYQVIDRIRSSPGTQLDLRRKRPVNKFARKCANA